MPDRPNFPIPENINAEPFCLCIQVPNDPIWKQVVAGLLDELNQWYNWQRDEARSGKECAQVWRNLYSQIDWTTMSCCCGQFDTIYRWTVDGVLQSSTDNGETWTDNPTQDPRNSSPLYPPIDGEDTDDKKCIAATGIRNLIEEQVGDNLTDDMTRYTLLELVTDWVQTYIQSSNPFQALLTIITNQILALVIAVLRPELTETVYNQLQCILYNNMSSDASFTDTQWSQVRDDITSDIGGIAGVFFEHLVYLLGSVGLTNIARSSGAIEGDCSDCDEFWCFDGDFTSESFDTVFSGLDITGGQNYNTYWTDGVGWQTTNGSPNYSILVWLMDDIPGLRYLKFTMTDNADVTVDGRGDTLHGTFTEHYQNPDVGLYWDGSATNPYHMYGKRSAPIISAFHAEGVGANPFGSDNCSPDIINPP